MGNLYKITSIDSSTNAVYVHFEYNGHILEHTIYPTIPAVLDKKGNIITPEIRTVNDVDLIKSAVESDYASFKEQMDKMDSAPDLPQAVSDLIGVSVDEV